MSSRDLQAVVKTQKAFIKDLLDRLERKEIIVSKPKLFFHDVPLDIDELNESLNDSYFTGLNLQQIFGLAKKSIRLTDDNCKMRHRLEDIEEIVNAIYDYQVEFKDKTNKEFLDKQLQKISDKLLDK